MVVKSGRQGRQPPPGPRLKYFLNPLQPSGLIALIGRNQLEDFHLLIGFIDPIVDRESVGDRDLNPPALGIIINVIGMGGRKPLDFPEMIEEIAPPARRERLQQTGSLQIDQQAIRHKGRRLFAQALFSVFESNPSARGFIVDPFRQPLLETRIRLAIQGHQMRREMAALGRREALGLLLQFG